jgi:DNA-binding MarR family transcriptional regulator
MVREVTEPTTSGGVLEERWSSPGLLLALLGQEAMRRLRDALNAHDLKPRQHYLLGLLHDHGPMGQRELGETMGVDPSILVSLLNPLEVDGFVSRERDPADRRRHVVTLTTAGRRLDDDQRRQLGAVLAALRDDLASGHDDACAPPETSDDC